MSKKNIFIVSIIILAAAAGIYLWMSGGFVSEEKIYRIGVVSFGGGQVETIEGLKEGMKNLGYTENKNIYYHIIDAAGSDEKAKAAAEEFLKENVDVVYSVSSPVTAQVLKVVTQKPVVYNLVSDPVGSGFAKSLLSSGNNTTGCSNYVMQTGGKRLEILKEILPEIKNVLVLYDPKTRFGQGAIGILRDAAKVLNVALSEKTVASKEDTLKIMQELKQGQYDAFFHTGEAKVTSAINDVINSLKKAKLPGMAHESSMAERGMFVTYGPSWRLLGNQCAALMDKVLKGVKPADIPVLTPEKLELIINLKTAEEIGIEVPESIKNRADKLIK